ncbi:MAG: TerB family tellurite resistance protein [Chroococcales cyanobacterium]
MVFVMSSQPSDSNKKSWFSSVTQSAAGLGVNIKNSVSQVSQGVFAKGKGNKQPSESNPFQEQLTEKMMGLFDMVIEERQRYYALNPHKVPEPHDVLTIVEKCASTNSKIALAANIIPGPWGLLAAVPEITLVIRNQLAMIYDIGMAYGKGNVLDRELLAGIFSYALGSRGVGLIAVQGGKIVVKRVTANLFRNVVFRIVRPIGQRLINSLVGKFVPIAGAVAMAAWAKYSTREIAKKATIIVKQPIEYSNEVLDDLNVPVDDLEDTSSETSGINDTLRIQSLINLIKVDGKIEAEEREYIHTFVKNADASDADKMNLLMSIDNNSKFSIDYSQFAKSPDDAVGLLIDLVALSKHDGEFHISEKMYIKQVGKAMGFSESDIEEMMATG